VDELGDKALNKFV